jgi:hypothetical protein
MRENDGSVREEWRRNEGKNEGGLTPQPTCHLLFYEWSQRRDLSSAGIPFFICDCADMCGRGAISPLAWVDTDGSPSSGMVPGRSAHNDLHHTGDVFSLFCSPFQWCRPYPRRDVTHADSSILYQSFRVGHILHGDTDVPSGSDVIFSGACIPFRVYPEVHLSFRSFSSNDRVLSLHTRCKYVPEEERMVVEQASPFFPLSDIPSY